MQPDKTTIERAFDLARSGACRDIREIVGRLDREGYDGRQIPGRILKKQLMDFIEEAKASAHGKGLSARKARPRIRREISSRRVG
ncbi:hypothetical protein FEV16_15195 [Methylocystis sp. B8]|nr:hypothetical protein FEV16_15195 [Methylocystis sp. B8]